MKTGKKILSLVLVLIMCLSIVPMANLGIEARAVTFAQLNDSSVFLKQQESRTCTLCAAAMMMRRYSMLRGDSGWNSITESSIKSTAWLTGAGLYNSFAYSNSSVSTIKVANYSLPGGSSNASAIIEELKKCPEGIVLYNVNAPHAILLTDYTNGIFYCADPANGIASGRIPISQAYKVTINNATSYWKVTSPVVDGPTENHTHSYVSYSEAAHPHNYYEKCSCGDWYYTGTTNDSYNYGYESAHPHKEYKTCWCGNTSYTGGRKTVRSCESCWDIEFTTTKESISILGGKSDTFTLGMSGGVFPEGAKYNWEYDESVISVEKNGNDFTVTGLRYASTDLIFTAYTDSTLTEVITSLTIPVIVQTPAIYFIFYNANGGENAPGTQTKTYGNDKALSSDKPTREGYTFLGWSADSEATEPDRNYDPGDTYSANARITLYAVWKKVFYGDVNEDGKISLADVTVLNNLRLFDTDKTSVRVLKGDLDGDGELTSDDLDLLNNFRLGNITSFPVENMFFVFEIEDEAKKMVYKPGEEISVDGMTVNVIYNNCTVHNIDTGFTVSPTIASDVGKQKVTVTFGDWSVDYFITVENSYTLSYNSNGGSGAPSSQTGATSYTISSTVPTKRGYTFLGWSKSSSVSSATYKPVDNIILSNDTTLYAVWKAAEPMLEGEGYEVSIDFAKQELNYTFTPTVSGEYSFESFSSIDTKVYVYDSSWTQIGYNDDDGVGNNFLLNLDLTAGNKYYVKVGTYGSYTGDLTFGVALYEEEHTHSYSSSITTQSTCTKTGVRTYKCTCGVSYTEIIAKTSHNSNTTIPAVSANCTKTGLTEGKKCSGCGAITVAQTTTNAIGHKDNNFDGKCDNCGISSGTADTPSDSTKGCSCNCHAGGIKAFFFKILNFFQKLFGINKICACGVKH